MRGRSLPAPNDSRLTAGTPSASRLHKSPATACSPARPFRCGGSTTLENGRIPAKTPFGYADYRRHNRRWPMRDVGNRNMKMLMGLGAAAVFLTTACAQTTTMTGNPDRDWGWKVYNT